MRALITTLPLASETPKKRASKLNSGSGHIAVSSASSLPPVQIDQALVKLVLETLDDSKAENVISINLLGKTSIADVMVVASGRSDRHVGAIAEHIVQSLKEHGHDVPRVEGFPQCDWVLIDAGDMIIHVFRPEVREFYNLEKMWGTDRPQEFPVKGTAENH